MQLVIAPNTEKKLENTDTIVLQNPVTKRTNTEAKAGNWKVMKLCKTQPLKYCTI